LTGAADGAEVQWRHDYRAAREEARQKNRPLFMDVGTANCHWCTQLDVSTFRDPTIVQQLNQDFIPVRIDADRMPSFAQAMQINSYPTLVFASPEGQVLGKHEGYLDAGRFGRQASQALARMPALVKPAAPAQTVAAPTPMAPHAVAPPMQLLSDAQQLLADARGAFQGRRFLSCLEHCNALMFAHANRPEAAEARHLAAQIKGDSTCVRELCQQLADQLAELHLAQADAALRADDAQQAASLLERVAQVSPGSLYARMAAGRLVQLRANDRGEAGPTVRAQSP